MSKTWHWKRRRQQLMEIDPHCYYCGCELVSFETDGTTKLPSNFATIEHLVDRWDFDERKRKYESREPNTVLACHRCNSRQNSIRVSKIPVEVRRKINMALDERIKLGIKTPRPEYLKEKGII